MRSEGGSTLWLRHVLKPNQAGFCGSGGLLRWLARSPANNYAVIAVISNVIDKINY